MKLKKWLAASAICALALAVGACGGQKDTAEGGRRLEAHQGYQGDRSL